MNTMAVQYNVLQYIRSWRRDYCKFFNNNHCNLSHHLVFIFSGWWATKAVVLSLSPSQLTDILTPSSLFTLCSDFIDSETPQTSLAVRTWLQMFSIWVSRISCIFPVILGSFLSLIMFVFFCTFSSVCVMWCSCSQSSFPGFPGGWWYTELIYWLNLFSGSRYFHSPLSLGLIVLHNAQIYRYTPVVSQPPLKCHKIVKYCSTVY